MTPEARVAPLEVTVALDPWVWGSAAQSAQAVAAAVEAELRRLSSALHVARPSVVTVREGVPGHGPVEIAVDGQDCAVPDDVLEGVLGYVDGTLGRPARSSTRPLLADEQGHGQDRLGRTVALLCREAVGAQPALLHGEGSRQAGGTDQERPPGEDRDSLSLLAVGVPAQRDDDGGVRTTDVEEAISRGVSDRVVVLVDPGYLRDLVPDGWSAGRAVAVLREEHAARTGLPLPDVGFERDEGLGPDAFAFRLNAVTGAPRRGPAAGQLLVDEDPLELERTGWPVVPVHNPLTGTAAGLVAAAHRPELEALGLRCADAWEHLLQHLAVVLRRRGHWLLTRGTAERLLDVATSDLPALRSAMDSRCPAALLAPVLRRASADGLPLWDLPLAVEHVLRHETQGPAGGRAGRDAAARRALVPALADSLSRDEGVLSVHALSADVERRLLSLGGHRAASTDDVRDVARGVAGALTRHAGRWPPVVLCSSAARARLRQLTRGRFPDLVVLADDEVPESCAVRVLGEIDLGG